MGGAIIRIIFIVSHLCCIQVNQRACVVQVVFCQDSNNNKQQLASVLYLGKYNSNVAQFRMMTVSFAAKNITHVHFFLNYCVLVIPNLILTL